MLFNLYPIRQLRLALQQLIKIFTNQVKSGRTFTVGQAKKWINMTLKQLSIAKPDFTKNHYSFYHVPIDSYLLKSVLANAPSAELRQLCSFGQINGKQTLKPIAVWSKINDYEAYLNFQQAFRHHYQNQQAQLNTEFHL